ncbi:hypothetical protein DFP72DRAFT_925920 [Ephemerocybe angulata]|uniref:Uncharacterized protein n=1 Tax=Ephemerocybe angulata TaxID=980116 RepID=A0A8H6HES5_9AGAR|nr:hypothetical protein DFP72DRAFT_925920 [Tulosesus angulatus]
MIEVPEELISEILSHLRVDVERPTDLRGLQVGLTCKDLYEEFHPLIASVHISQLLEATHARRLTIQPLYSSPHCPSRPGEPARWLEGRNLDTMQYRLEALFYSPAHLRKSEMSLLFDPEEAFTDGLQITYTYGPYLKLESEMWSLHSFLSRPQISSKLRRVRLGFDAGWWAAVSGRRGHSQPPWGRVHTKLLQLCAELSNVQLEIMEDPPFWTDKKDSTSPSTFSYTSHGRSSIFIHEHAKREPVAGRGGVIESRQVEVARSGSTGGIFRKLTPVKCSQSEPSTSTPVASVLPSTPTRHKTSRKGQDMVGTDQVVNSRLSPKALASLKPAFPTIDGQLSSIHLNGRIFHLQPSWFHHIDSLLSKCSFSLAHLRLEGLGFTHLDWSAILSKWRFPNLAFLSVENAEIPFPVLVSFLHSHPTIASANLMLFKHIRSSTHPSSDSSARTEFTFLPNLQTLTSTPRFIHALVTSKVHFATRLKHLGISQKHKYPAPPDLGSFEDITSILSHIASYSSSQFKALEALSLSLPYTRIHLARWLSSFATAQAPSPPTNPSPATLVPKFLRRKLTSSSESPQATGLFAALRSISILSLSFFQLGRGKKYSLDDDNLILYSITDFMAAFPALRIARLEGPRVHAGPGTADVILDPMWERCGSLQTVSFELLYPEPSVGVFERPERYLKKGMS